MVVCSYWFFINEILVVSACHSWISISSVRSSKADCEKVYFSLHHCIKLSCLLPPDSFSLPGLLLSHTSFCSFPSTTFCPHLGSFLHQSQLTLFRAVSSNLSSLSIPLTSIHLCLFLFWLRLWSLLELPPSWIKTRLLFPQHVKLSHCPSSPHSPLKRAESSGFSLPF